MSEANTSARIHYLSLLKANPVAMKIHGNLIFQDKILVFEDKVGLGTEVSHAVNSGSLPKSFTVLYDWHRDLDLLDVTFLTR